MMPCWVAIPANITPEVTPKITMTYALATRSVTVAISIGYR